MLLSPSFKPVILGARMLDFGTQVFELDFLLHSVVWGFLFVSLKWMSDIGMTFEILNHS